MDEGGEDPGTGSAQRMPEGDGATVDVDPVGVELELTYAGQRLGGERLVELDEVEVGGGRGRLDPAPCVLPGPGRSPSRRDELPPPPTRPPGPSAPTGDGRNPSSVASSKAAAPSFIGEEFPAVTVPPSRKTGRSDGERLERGIGSGSLVGGQRRRGPTALVGRGLDRFQFGLEPPRPAVPPPPSGGWRGRSSSCCSRSDSVPLGDDLGGLAHRQQAVELGHPRIDQPPAERGVAPSRELPVGKARSGLAITHGARLIDSEPPATITSPHPPARACAAVITACIPDPQSRLTVAPGTLSGRPASSTAIRATLRLSSPAWLAAPHITSSMASTGRARDFARQVCGSHAPRGRPA